MDLQERLTAIDKKLDTLLYGQSNLETRVKGVEDQVRDVVSTVRGHNGSQGLVTEVYLLKGKVDDIAKSIEANNEERREDRKADREKEITISNKGKEDDGDDDFVSWKWIMEKAVVPVLISFILWFLLTVLPKLSASLGL